ncbi:SWI/SNF complex subunit SWI3D-like isoform X2 [Tripterygium wilfordii]|uniref:SWI/SNF complex subunit SWI3D-like isoform X2 n=1 Tax=Tripterygium wilfordii TaxID=458696 RepID=UPI0018F80E80|nr:SWI/SNF complex subunit SWI3D-like isoform X2 [Tripterygium wilfordii]
MEDKRRDGGTLPPASSYAGTETQAGEPVQSRRRAGGQKRKANVLFPSNTSSTPSKRVTREKNLSFHSSIHNGPLTRARQSPNSVAYVASAVAGVKLEEKPILTADAALADDERRKANEAESEALAAIEAEFEAIRSRDANSHVVPSHCGWFSWKKIHVLEERALPTFFNNKSETRTPGVYLEIRNWIVKKFHSNPNVLIELKDLSELEVGDSDAQQEVMEFLDYWGLINFHPFPQKDVAVASTDDNRTAKVDSLLDKFYRFEAIQPCPSLVPKPNIKTPTMPLGVFPTSAIAEDLVRSEGPDYHCNSCSADCSQKRYHCQTQADYDLCTDCFNSGKFGSDMSSSDFILMVPAEAPGVSSGKWTDQETLLLLEALELYKENWNEIAEHVATKTKAQCILHFVQMPIEETFLDSGEGITANSKETADPAASTNDSSVPKDDKETDEGKSRASEDQPSTSPMEETKPEDACEAKTCQETSKTENVSDMKVGEEGSTSAGTGEVKAAHKTGENIALKALREAFRAVGYFPTPGRPLSFGEVGNPVMALVVFLARLVGSDVANASARSSLKAMSSNSPGQQLATRHCFVLDDPPIDKNETGASESVVTEMVDRQTDKDIEEQINNQKEDSNTSGLSNRDLAFKKDEKNENSIPKGQRSLISENVKPAELHAENESASREVPGNIDESRNSKLAKDLPPNIVKESDDLASKADFPPSYVMGHEEETALGEHSQLSEVENVKKLSGTLTLEKDIHSHLATSGSVGEPSLPAEVSKDVDKTSDSLPHENNEQRSVISNSVREESQATEVTKDVDMVCKSLPSEKNGQQSVSSDPAGGPSLPLEAQKDVDMMSDPLSLENNEPLHPSNSVIENGTNAGENQIKDSKMDGHDCTVTKDMQDIDKLKRAAASAISAAAVKAKVLADQEEEEIRQLVASMIEKQLHKLETKLAFFNEMDSIVMRGKEQLERSRHKLFHERGLIIASRLGLPPSSSRAGPPSLPANRVAMNFANSVPRSPLNMTSIRPPILRPMGTAPPTSNPFVASPVAGSTVQPSGQDRDPSVVTK